MDARKGASNKRTHLARKLIGRIPRQRDLPVSIALPPLKTLEDCDHASELVLKKASAGKISWGEALAVSAAIESRCRALESRDLESRVKVLEHRSGELP